MFAAVQQKVVNSGQFAMKLTEKGSELYIGGADRSLYRGEIEWHPTDHNQGVYVIDDATVFVGDKEVLTKVDTIIDSGTSLMGASPSVAKAIHAAIPGAARHEQSGQGLWTVPCDSDATVSFNWGGETWTVPTGQ